MSAVTELKEIILEKKELFCSSNRELWENPEVGYHEFHAVETLKKALLSEGFAIAENLGGLPTAFSASYGQGSPVIGILAEYDALPGLSQEAVPHRQPSSEGKAGHGCGHCILGTGALAGAVAAKSYLQKHRLPGTIVFMGCPAEEFGYGKMFMARSGCFNHLDAALTWHPADSTAVWGISSLANISAYFHFEGKSAHASTAPHLGRSALDACELMNVGVNYLREHVPTDARMHYAYEDVGGKAPNIVQEHATLHYYLRSPKIEAAKQILTRVQDVAAGAALMTSTKLTCEVDGSLCDYRPNKALGELLDSCLREVGTPDFDQQDFELANSFRATFGEAEKNGRIAQLRPLCSEEYLETMVKQGINTLIAPNYYMPERALPGSTDVGDVSYITPTAQFTTACSALGSGGHTWQMTAQMNSPLAHKGMLQAGTVLALAVVKLFTDSEILQQATIEHRKTIPNGYICLVADDVKPKIESK